MIPALANAMRTQAALMDGARALVMLGIVQSFDPNKYAVKVMLQPDGIETGWLPLTSIWIGNNWGLFAPPNPGDMVDVHFVEGSIEAGFVSQRFYNNQARPLAVLSGEFWLVHKSGSFIKFTNDQKLSLNGQVELDLSAPTINLTATSQVNLTAPAINIGSQGESLLALVNSLFMALFNAHVHGGVQAGSGTSAPPVTPMTSAQLTTALKGG